MAHIVQLANFVTPTSGGIRRVVERLRVGYAEYGHRTTVVVPGPRAASARTRNGTVVTLRAPRLPATGGYRVIVDRSGLQRLLDSLAPDAVEVSDRLTLRGIGTWATAHGVPSTVIIHERLDLVAGMHLPFPLRPAPLLRRDAAAVASRFDTVVSPSPWAARELALAGLEDVKIVGWGVDLRTFHPDRRSAAVRRRLLRDADVLIAMACRLSPEKRPLSVLDAIASLLARGVRCRLVIAGTGASAARMRRKAAGLPVTFLGHLRGRRHVAEVLAAADVAICPGPVETFGLAALESLACGTPVVSARSGAIAELLHLPHGASAHNHGPAFASAIARVLAQGAAARAAARAFAEGHDWSTAVEAMLRIHRLLPEPADAPAT